MENSEEITKNERDKSTNNVLTCVSNGEEREDKGEEKGEDRGEGKEVGKVSARVATKQRSAVKAPLPTC